MQYPAPPSATLVQFDPYWANVVLLIAGNGPIVDLAKGKTITVGGNAAYSDSANGIVFDGTGDYLQLANDADFGMGTGDYTVECDFLTTTGAAEQDIFDFRPSAGGAPKQSNHYVTTSTGLLAIYDGTTIYGNSGSNVLGGVWRSIAWSRVSGTTAAYRDFARQWTDSATRDMTSSRPLVIGANFAFGGSVNGRLRNIRITKGVGRYSGTSYEPPVMPFPNH